MGKRLSLVAADGLKLGAYRADPAGKPKGGVVVIQEIFGVNHHIRSVVDRLSAEGYAAVAPALFDRTHPGFESGYTPDEGANAGKFAANPDWAAILRDTEAAMKEPSGVGRLAIMK
jgi:carboxymethylenebutenolidase